MAVLHTHLFGDPSGEPLLAVHGIGGHGRRYRRLAEESLPHRHTVAVDLRGHGRSTYDAPWAIPQHVADLTDTLDSRGLGVVDFVGHSFGATLGLALLATAPDRIRRLVLLDPAVAQPGESGSQSATRTIEDPGWATVAEAARARNAGLGDDLNPGVAEDIDEHLVQGDDGRFRFRVHKPAVVTAFGEVCTPLPAVLRPVPALLAVADRAGMVTGAIEARLHALFCGQLQVVHLDSGHMVYWERFDETAAAISAFLV